MEMSITMGSTSMNSFKRIKMQYVALAGGVAIAVAAAIGAASIEGDSKAAPQSSISPAPAIGWSVKDFPRVVYYVVESHEAKARLEASLAADEMARIEAGGPELQNLFLHVLVADSPEAEAAAMHTIFNANAEATEFGTFTVDFVDLRPDLTPVD
jgi:hypothetical protein